MPVTWWNLGLCILFIGIVLPNMTYTLFAVSRLFLGTLYPAYASYKAVRTKNVREYVSYVPLSERFSSIFNVIFSFQVKWMMYWIVFALFTSIETVADVFIAFW